MHSQPLGVCSKQRYRADLHSLVRVFSGWLPLRKPDVSWSSGEGEGPAWEKQKVGYHMPWRYSEMPYLCLSPVELHGQVSWCCVVPHLPLGPYHSHNYLKKLHPADQCCWDYTWYIPKRPWWESQRTVPPWSVEKIKARAVCVQQCFGKATHGRCPDAFPAMWASCIAITGKRIATRVSKSQSVTSLFVPLGFWILPTLSNLMTLRSVMEKSFIAGACERSGLRFWSLSRVLLIPTRESVSVWSSCSGRARAFPQELRNVQSAGQDVLWMEWTHFIRDPPKRVATV